MRSFRKQGKERSFIEVLFASLFMLSLTQPTLKESTENIPSLGPFINDFFFYVTVNHQGLILMANSYGDLFYSYKKGAIDQLMNNSVKVVSQYFLTIADTNSLIFLNRISSTEGFKINKYTYSISPEDIFAFDLSVDFYSGTTTSVNCAEDNCYAYFIADGLPITFQVKPDNSSMGFIGSFNTGDGTIDGIGVFFTVALNDDSYERIGRYFPTIQQENSLYSMNAHCTNNFCIISEALTGTEIKKINGDSLEDVAVTTKVPTEQHVLLSSDDKYAFIRKRDENSDILHILIAPNWEERQIITVAEDQLDVPVLPFEPTLPALLNLIAAPRKAKEFKKHILYSIIYKYEASGEYDGSIYLFKRDDDATDPFSVDYLIKPTTNMIFANEFDTSMEKTLIIVCESEFVFTIDLDFAFCGLNIPYCKECLDETHCSTCNDGFTLLADKTNCTCSEDGKTISESKCVNCEDIFPECTSCTKDECLACKDSFYLDGTCKGCPDNCTECNSATECTSCMEDYYLEGTCKPCENIEGCTKCDISGCLECEDGSWKNGLECVICPQKCTKCQSNEKCLDCEEGHYLAGICVNCSAINCLTCDINAVCGSCAERYFLNETKCSNCPIGCSKCNSQDDCTECDNYYYYDNKKCHECEYMPNCISCTKDGNCTRCLEGFELVDGLCGQCLSDPRCLLCHETNCLVCVETSFLLDGKCQDCFNISNCDVTDGCETNGTCIRCSNGYVLEYEGTQCFPCSDRCQVCQDLHSCVKCEDDYLYMYERCRPCSIQYGCKHCNTNECLECEEGFYLDNDNHCNPCFNNCLMCEDHVSCNECIQTYVLYPVWPKQCLIPNVCENNKCFYVEEGFQLNSTVYPNCPASIKLGFSEAICGINHFRIFPTTISSVRAFYLENEVLGYRAGTEVHPTESFMVKNEVTASAILALGNSYCTISLNLFASNISNCETVPITTTSGTYEIKSEDTGIDKTFVVTFAEIEGVSDVNFELLPLASLNVAKMLLVPKFEPTGRKRSTIVYDEGGEELGDVIGDGLGVSYSSTNENKTEYKLCLDAKGEVINTSSTYYIAKDEGGVLYAAKEGNLEGDLICSEFGEVGKYYPVKGRVADPKPPKKSKTGLIVGSAVGGGAVILIAIGVVVAFVIIRKKTKRKRVKSENLIELEMKNE